MACEKEEPKSVLEPVSREEVWARGGGSGSAAIPHSRILLETRLDEQ